MDCNSYVWWKNIRFISYSGSVFALHRFGAFLHVLVIKLLLFFFGHIFLEDSLRPSSGILWFLFFFDFLIYFRISLALFNAFSFLLFSFCCLHHIRACLWSITLESTVTLVFWLIWFAFKFFFHFESCVACLFLGLANIIGEIFLIFLLSIINYLPGLVFFSTNLEFSHPFLQCFILFFHDILALFSAS